MPHRQRIATKAKMLMRCREALKLTSEGLSQVDVATRMGVSTDSVKRYVQKALLTESMFPSSLTPEEVSHLRLLQAEVLANSRRMALETQATVNTRVGTSAEKSGDAQAVARLLEAVTRAVELESNLFGTRQPLRIVEESMRLEVRKIDNKVTIVWDESMLKDDGRPVPGLHIGVAPALLEARTRALQEQNGEDG
jgi:transposase